MAWMQQPLEQKKPSPQSALVSQTAPPPGHSFCLHSGGRSSSVWPGHSTQPSGSHAVPHSSTCVQRGHSSGSSSVVSSQSGDVLGLIATSTQVSPSQIVQQPKQSQPGGVTALQYSMQSAPSGSQSRSGSK